mgnify:CR=1 FL=1
MRIRLKNEKDVFLINKIKKTMKPFKPWVLTMKTEPTRCRLSSMWDLSQKNKVLPTMLCKGLGLHYIWVFDLNQFPLDILISSIYLCMWF